MARETENYMAGIDPYEPITDADEGWVEPAELILPLMLIPTLIIAVGGAIFYFC